MAIRIVPGRRHYRWATGMDWSDDEALAMANDTAKSNYHHTIVVRWPRGRDSFAAYFGPFSNFDWMR